MKSHYHAHNNVQLMSMSQDVFHGMGESIFGSAAPTLVGLGWSVFPQEPHGSRRPGSVMGEMIRWDTDHHLKDSLPGAHAMRQWLAHCGTLNVACVMGRGSGHVFAVDVDALDQDVSAAIQALAFKHLGRTPFVRVGCAPKAALLYRSPADAPVRSVSRTLTTGEDNAVEILGAGKPLTIHGRHHRTGQFFKWMHIEGNPLVCGPEAAPVATWEMVDAFLGAVESRFGFRQAAQVASSVALTGTEDVSGLRLPRVSGEKVSDGRFALLNRLVFRTVLDNSNLLHAAQAAGTVPETKARLVAGVVQAFGQAAEMTGRWTPFGVAREAAPNVSRTADRILLGELEATHRPQPQTTRTGPIPVVRYGVMRPARSVIRWPTKASPASE